MSVKKSKYGGRSRTRWLGVIALSKTGAQILFILAVLGIIGFSFSLITLAIGIVRTQVMFGYVSEQATGDYVNAYQSDIMLAYIPALIFVLFMLIFCIYSAIIGLRISRGQ